MNSAWKRAISVVLTLALVTGSFPSSGIRTALADDPAGQPLEAPADTADEPLGDDSTEPAEPSEPADPYTPVEPEPLDHAHVYDEDGVCTICGKPVAWDTNYVDDDHRGIYFYAVDENGDIAYQFTDEQLAQVAIISSMTRLDNPDYRYEFGLSSINTGVTTLYWYDVIADQISKFTAKYDQLDCVLSMDNENHVPQLTDIKGGRAEVRLISTFDEETGTYSPLSVNGNPLFELDFYLNLAKPGEVPDPIQTVDSRSAGFTVNLYDYTADNAPTEPTSVAADGPLGAPAATEGINAISDLQFFDDADASTADSSAESNAVSEDAVALQGIVEPELGDDGYPALTEFEGDSLDVLFDTTDIRGAKNVYADVNHLFKEEDGYLVYSSDENYAYYDTAQGNGGDFQVLGATYNQARQTDTALIDSGVPIGFFPLNAYNDLANNLEEASEDELTHNTGMSIETSFTLPASGKADGEALTFSYTGDDDAWLYIDGVLVLDAGGIHSKLNATVDFASGKVTVGNASAIEAADRTIGRGSTLAQIFEDAGKEWKAEGEHTLKFYSLERDGKQSDLIIKTNLNKVTNSKVTDVVVTKEWVDENGEPCDPWADSVTVQLYQTIDGKTTAVPDGKITLTAEDDWTNTFGSLPAFDANGKRITYSVKETATDGTFATYEVGGVTQQTKVYWVLYDASKGVEPGLYAILSNSNSGEDTQPVLLTSVGQDKEVTFNDTFFVNESVTDPKTGEGFDQYIEPVGESQIWTISPTQPQTYVTRELAPGYQTDENGYTILKTTSSTGYVYPGNVSPALFYEKDNHIYTKDSKGNYKEVDGTVYPYSSGSAWRVDRDLSLTPRTKQETDENGYDLYFTMGNVNGQGYGWIIYYVKDGLVYERNGSSYTPSDVALSSLSPLNAVAHEDGYVVLFSTSPMGQGTYYTTDNWDGVYRKNPDGTFTKLEQYGDYVPSGFYANASAVMEDGYYVMDGSDGNTYYILSPMSTVVIYRKAADGSYEPVPNGYTILYAQQNYTENESTDYMWQIANKGMNLTLVGPGQQWMDYTYITSNVGTKQGSSNSGGTDDATFSDFNYRDVFRFDTYTVGQTQSYGYTTNPDPTAIPYDDPTNPLGGLRIYSFQELWQFTGLITGYEKNLAIGSQYETKENYATGQAGHFWLYRPVYEEEPLDLTTADWTVVNRPAGDLAVTKTLTGNGASASDTFTFTIKLSGDEALVNQVSGTFGDIEFVGGMATVTLKGGETKTAKNLPAGLSYMVTETVLPGYELAEKTGDSGTIPVRSTATASFTNLKTVTPPAPTPTEPATRVKPASRAIPKTGEPYLPIVPMALVGVGLVVVSRRRRVR